MSSHPFPSPEEGFALHRRIHDRELVAPNELCECYLELLSDWLSARSPSIHPEDCCTAAIDALTDYFGHPEKYDPAKLELGAYLRMAARRDLSNLCRSEAKHQRRREADFRVEESQPVGNLFREEPQTVLARRQEQEAASRLVEDIRVACDEPERAVLALLIDGEREAIRYAAPLGVGHLPEKEMRREVKRVQDRLKKRIERKGEANDDPTRENG